MSKLSNKLIIAAAVYALASIYLKNKDDDDNGHYSIRDSLESATTKFEEYSSEIANAVEKKVKKLDVNEIKEKVNTVSEKATSVINDIAKAQETVTGKIIEKVENTITKNEEVSENSGPIIQVVAEATSEYPVIKENNDQPEADCKRTTKKDVEVKPKQKKEEVGKKEEKVVYTPRDEFDVSPYMNILLEGKTITPIKNEDVVGNIEDLIKNFESENNQHEQEEETKVVDEKEPCQPVFEKTMSLQDYIDSHQDLSDKKVTSIYNNVVNMTSTFKDCTYVTLIHIVQFDERKNQSDYVEKLSKEYEVTTHENEAYVVITVETQLQALVSHILNFASQANSFNGTYRGWKVDSTF